MAKFIKVTEEARAAVRAAFEQALSKVKSDDGKVNFSFSIGSVDRKATVYFTEIAWLKMIMLIKECDKEVGWHGIAVRGDDPAKDEYIVKDILVYPQEVTGTTVNPDQEEYQTWLYGHEDEVFNNIRMQGHSHVNMGVTPSSVDLAFYNRILDQLDDTMFYIFMIWNKRGDMTAKIYDLAKNVLFETGDVTVVQLPGDIRLLDFLRDAKSMVREKKYTGTYTGSYAGNYSGNYAGGSGNPASSGNYSSDYFGGRKNDPAPAPVTPLPTASGTGKKGKRKGKRPSYSGSQLPAAKHWYDDDYNVFDNDEDLMR